MGVQKQLLLLLYYNQNQDQNHVNHTMLLSRWLGKEVEWWDKEDGFWSESSITVREPMHCLMMLSDEYPGLRGPGCEILGECLDQWVPSLLMAKADGKNLWMEYWLLEWTWRAVLCVEWIWPWDLHTVFDLLCFQIMILITVLSSPFLSYTVVECACSFIMTLIIMVTDFLFCFRFQKCPEDYWSCAHGF